jgi:hypothetical protein
VAYGVRVRWPFDKRVDPALAWGVLGVGATFLVGLPALLAIRHSSGPFRAWWPTDWMMLPYMACAVGVVLILVPLRRSAGRGDRGARCITPADGANQVQGVSKSYPARQISMPRAGSSRQGPIAGGVDQVDDLTDLLGAIPDMAEPSFRQRVYGNVPQDVMQQVRRSDKTRIELVNLVETFQIYEHLHPWAALLEQLQRLLPEHPAVADLAIRLRQLGLATEKAVPGVSD